jgi:hypothetical protein
VLSHTEKENEAMLANLSRRAILAGAAAVPALAVPAAAVASEPDSKIVQIADRMIVEYDRLGTLDRDIEVSDCELYDALNEELWATPSSSIDGLIAKARILDKTCRYKGQPHSESSHFWDLIDNLLALGVQS